MASETETELLRTSLSWHQALTAEMELRLKDLDRNRRLSDGLWTSEYDRRIATIKEMQEIADKRIEELQVQVDTQGM